MFHALVTFAQEVAHGAEEETSKTAFYIAGSALAIWAVVLAGFGLSRSDDFPGNDTVGGAVIAITAVLVLGATATAVATG